MVESFVLPDTTNTYDDNLTHFNVENRLSVDILNDTDIRDIINNVSDIISTQPSDILSHEYFDQLYCLIESYNTLSSPSKQSIVSLLTVSSHTLINHIRAIIQSNDNNKSLSNDDGVDDMYMSQCSTYTNSVRCFVYLTCRVLQQLADTVNIADTIVDIDVNKKTKKKNKDTEPVSLIQLSEELCNILLCILCNSSLYQLHSSWLDIHTCVFNTTSISLTHTINLKTSSYRDVLFDLHALNVKKGSLYEQNNQCIMHTLTHTTNESTPVQLSQLINVFVGKYGVNNITAELTSELQTIDKHMLSDSNVCKSVSSFIVEMAVQCPKQMIHNISLLLNYLEHEHYMIRNGVLLVFGELIQHAFIPDTNVSDDSELTDDGLTKQQSELRDSLFDILDERKHDINSFTRSKVLQIWCSIASTKKVPFPQLGRVARIGVDRLNDKSSHVRKYAIQLLYTLIQYNPLSSNLQIDLYKQQLQDKANQFKYDMEVIDAQRRQSQSVKQEQLHDNDDQPQESQHTRQQQLLATRKSQLDILMLIVDFLTVYQNVLPTITKLLTSKTNSDVIECIEYCVIHRQFNCVDSDLPLKSMCSLVWSREPTIRESCIDAYKRIYLSVDLDTLNTALAHTTSIQIARELVALFTGVSLSVQTSLEELMLRCVQLQYVHRMVIQSLFDIFQSTSTTRQDRIITLAVLSSIANELKSVITDDLHLQCVIGIGFDTQQYDLQLTRIAAQMLCKLDHHSTFKDKIPVQAYTQLYKRVQSVILNSPSSIYHEKHWYSCCEQVINLVFTLHPQPDQYTADILKLMTDKLFSDSDDIGHDNVVINSAVVLSRLLFLIGHTSIKTLVQLESYEISIKKIKAKQMIRLEESKQAEYIASQTNTSKKKSTRQSVGAPSIEDELAVTASEEYELEQLREFNEAMLCDINYNQQHDCKDTLLSLYLPIIIHVCENINKQQYTQYSNLCTTAVLALCKFMTLTDKLCQTHIQLLITILRQSQSSTIKSNIIIGLGDLVYRWPNTIEPWSEHMYVGISDSDVSVRKHTLLVLTHLILNDMLKVKTPIADIALCIVDEHTDISNIAKLFFVSLSEKIRGVGIHDVLPDIIQRLSMNNNVSSDNYKVVIKYIAAFITKDKQIERLIDKLCHRFTNIHIDSNTDNTSSSDTSIKQCRDLSYCLLQLNYSVSSLKKLLSLFSLYSNKLSDDDVYECFTGIVSKSRKFAKSDVKQLIDQLESQLVSARDKCMDEVHVHNRANNAINKQYNNNIQYGDQVERSASDVVENNENEINVQHNHKSRSNQSARVKLEAVSDSKSRSHPPPRSRRAAAVRALQDSDATD